MQEVESNRPSKHCENKISSVLLIIILGWNRITTSPFPSLCFINFLSLLVLLFLPSLPLLMVIVVVFSMPFFHQWKEFYAVDLCAFETSFGNVVARHKRCELSCQLPRLFCCDINALRTHSYILYLFLFTPVSTLWHSSSKYVYATSEHTNPQHSGECWYMFVVVFTI